jgi:hypothetical protein
MGSDTAAASTQMEMPDNLRLAAFSFGVDRVTAQVTNALDAASVPSILLKGPVIATWLYAESGQRLYGDTDLLVRKADWKRAMVELELLDFVDELGLLAHPRMESPAGHPLERSADGAAVDLHCTLFGIGADPEVVWKTFSVGAVRQRVGGAEVSMPSHPARLLHIALHAVQHGGAALPKAMIDLERAVARVPAPLWREACELAERLDAAPTFAAGLRLIPPGRELADAIGAGHGEPTGAILRVTGVPLAEGFGELAEAPGMRGKLAIARRELFPNPAFMRWWTPLARRGPLGLAAAYVWRLLWLACHALPGYRAWRRAARRQR